MDGTSGKARFESRGATAGKEGIVTMNGGTSFKTFQRIGRSSYPAIASRRDCGPTSDELMSEWANSSKQISEGLGQF